MAKIKNCIGKDNDILTQFVEANFLMHKVECSADFNELVNNLNKYCIEVKDEEIIQKENDEWNNKK